MLHGRKSTVNHLEPIPEELIMVKKIFDVFLEKRSVQEVVRYTRGNSFLTKNGKKHTRVKQNIESEEAQSQNGVEFLFCRNSKNMLIPLIHITVPTKELSENPTVGERIRFYRFKQNLSLEELADMLNIDRSTMLRYETSSTLPSLEVLNNIAKNLNIPSSFLYDDYYSFIAYPYNEKIKEIRLKYGLTRLELAEKLGVSFKTIERWENKIHLINKEYFLKFKMMHLLKY